MAENETTPKICKIDGCGKKHMAKGLCSRHYYKLRYNGDPLGGRETLKGGPVEWIKANVDYNEPDCLIFPFSRVNGYGRVREGYAHSLMCTLVHGPKPFPKAEVRHSCGKGHLGCLHPSHLSWGTHAENMADRIDHGTSNPGELSPRTKLEEHEVLLVLALCSGGQSKRSLASEFGVQRKTIANIVNGRSWSSVTPERGRA
jgi:hypothetical protein